MLLSFNFNPLLNFLMAHPNIHAALNRLPNDSQYDYANDPSSLYTPLVLEVGHLTHIRCLECGGMGHTRRTCPTYKKVQRMVAGVKPWKSLVNKTRELQGVQSLPTNLGKRMRYV